MLIESEYEQSHKKQNQPERGLSPEEFGKALERIMEGFVKTYDENSSNELIIEQLGLDQDSVEELGLTSSILGVIVGERAKVLDKNNPKEVEEFEIFERKANRLRDIVGELRQEKYRERE